MSRQTEVIIGDINEEGAVVVTVDLQDHGLPVGLATNENWAIWLTREDVKRLRKVLKKALNDTEEVR